MSSARNGRPAHGQRVTIREVAEAAGVSVATVSKVLNDRYGVAGPTSERVRAVIEELGYESSLVARSLRNRRTNVIGILVADFEPFSSEVLKGAADAIRETDYELVAYSAGGRVAVRRARAPGGSRLALHGAPALREAPHEVSGTSVSCQLDTKVSDTFARCETPSCDPSWRA